MLTPKQTDAVASALLPAVTRNQKPVLQCPSCGAPSISPEARRRLLWQIQCPACESHLRLKWGRSLLLGYLAAVALLVVAVFVTIHGRRAFPGAIGVMWSICISVAFTNIRSRLPLERAT